MRQRVYAKIAVPNHGTRVRGSHLCFGNEAEDHGEEKISGGESGKAMTSCAERVKRCASISLPAIGARASSGRKP